jgi:ATP-dependent helicase Lhr and Lhr-like helicase
MFVETLVSHEDDGEVTAQRGAGVVAGMHPAVQAWFLGRFPEGPTEPQALGWPHVAAGEDTLIAAPTGSGKTLAGFLMCIDSLYQAA